MEPDELAEVIRSHLPAYLSEADYNKVTEQLKRFSEFRDYYILPAPTEKALQGDGWAGFAIKDDNEILKVRGMILSNSCDINPDNPSRPDRNVVFSPLIPLSAVLERFSEARYNKEKIRQNIDLIRKQLVSDIFFLPASAAMDVEWTPLFGQPEGFDKL
ncbi:MAG: hypothetical protein H0V62_02165 [Gammaproteobacteria bacterium]|nr:hypothetical protein [Gammaproteobacteria bacterium]